MANDEITLKAAQGGDEHAFERLIAPYERELRVHCYRMAGSLQEADDLMQESLLKAWKGLPGFEWRSNLRTWLFKVATNACLDALEQRKSRVLPLDLGPAASAADPIGPPRLDLHWIDPCPADFYASSEPSPAARYEIRQSVSLAFLAAIQLLPAKQRAVLILQEVVGFQAAECAELLDLSVAAVNSALQRARGTLAARGVEPRTAPPTVDHSLLLARYVRAWERADVDSLVAVLVEDATLAMPPLAQWLSGAETIGESIGHMVFTPVGAGSLRLIPTEANGQPAFAAYERKAESGELHAMAIHVLELRAGKVAVITAFLNPALFSAFGLPMKLGVGN